MAYSPLTLWPRDASGSGPESSLGPRQLDANGVSPYSILGTYQTPDEMSVVRGATYFSGDVKMRGMLPGDTMFVVTMLAGVPTSIYFTGVMAVTASGADLADGTAINLTNT